MTLVIPVTVWQTATAALRQPPHDRERIAYLDGPRPQNTLAVATTVTVPNADQHQGHFRVTADEMSRAGKHLRRLGLMRLAQIHSHPTGWVGHSGYDDAMAFSQRDGAISIVAPDFAGCAPGLSDCGVHVRDAAGWRELTPEETRSLMQIVPSVIQLAP